MRAILIKNTNQSVEGNFFKTMESKSFNTIDDEKLIECVRNYPVLNKLKDKNNKDNSIKENFKRLQNTLAYSTRFL
ncbi:Uncharacterized protein FWK35_00017529 [Aphis craccivora]|uniref:Uncharacterized protein n=1 Tax=Aphis craccivora TaxID=307492 RepID=A0A6G0XB40_APHCR|nr:Uncharacterized protein FWK35_00017529 [Aphis craccivora]